MRGVLVGMHLVRRARLQGVGKRACSSNNGVSGKEGGVMRSNDD